MRATLNYTLMILLCALGPCFAGEVGQDGSRTTKYDNRVVPFQWREGSNTKVSVYCGWYCGTNLFVTCKHNTDHKQVGDTVATPDGGIAKLVYLTSNDSGVAVWEMSKPIPRSRTIRVSQSDPKPGDEVFHIGMPEGKPTHCTIGKVTSVMKDDSFNGFLTSSNYAQGYSGGPTMNINGDVVGINIGTDPSPLRGYALIASIDELRVFLTGYRRDTNSISGRPFVDVLVAGDFICKPCSDWLEYARSTGAAGRGFDFHVRKISYSDCVKRGIAVPMFSIGDDVYRGSLKDFSMIDQWANHKFGMNKAPVTPTIDTLPIPVDLPASLTPEQREDIKNATQLPPGVTASPEALQMLLAATSPAEKHRKPDPVVNWDGIKIFIAVSDNDESVSIATEGPGRRSLERLSEGKADIQVITELSRPTKFEEYEKAIGVNIDQLYVSVLIPDSGSLFPVEFAIREIELMLNANISNNTEISIRDIPVEPIMESLSPGDYHIAHELFSDIGEVEESGSVLTFPIDHPVETGLAAALLFAAYSYIPKRFFKRKEEIVDVTAV